MLQPQTLLETVLHVMQQAVAEATAAIMRAFQDGSPERMQLALDHLRKALPGQAGAQSSRDAHVEDLIDAYADPTLHPDIERIARVMTTKAYKNGHCYASQEKIARWTRLAKSTLQLRLHEMERLELIRVERRPGTSSITLFADGTLDALRLKKIKKIGRRERENPRVMRTFTVPGTQNLGMQGLRALPSADSWPKNTSCSVSHSTVISNDIISIHSTRACNESMEIPTDTSAHDDEAKKNDDNITSQSFIPQKEKREHSKYHNGKEKRQKPTPISISMRSNHPASPRTAAQLLIAEGVSPSRAHEFARLFDHNRIEKTIALSLHREKNNPPAYLLRLIQDNTAARYPVLGSEADLARQRERRQTVLRDHIATPKTHKPREQSSGGISPTPSLPSSVSSVISGTFSGGLEPSKMPYDPLEGLSPEDRVLYVDRAREEVLRVNPWLGNEARQNTGPLMQAMIRKQLRASLPATPPPSWSFQDVARVLQ